MVNWFVLNGLGWFSYKVGWALTKWKGLDIDLVVVNQIICTPLT